jgi:hypothetical protein
MKLFISYHLADRKAVNKIKSKLDAMDISYFSVDENSDFNGWPHQKISDYIMHEMSDCSILLCMVGRETYCRPHVDYELHHSLKNGCGARLGWIVVLLDNRGDSVRKIDFSTFPNRIQDNLEYACITSNSSLFNRLDVLMNEADKKRNNRLIQIDNKRNCMALPKKKYYDQSAF